LTAPGTDDGPEPEMPKIKAIALLSGGLDSILALKMMLDQGLDIIALNLTTPFSARRTQAEGDCSLVAERYQVPLRSVYGAQDYVEMVRCPSHGYGKNMNPCIDCRIYLLRKAKEIMEKEGAELVFSGEVLGERPMSQRRVTMDLIERESGLKGRLLRPLSAKLLEPTLAEMQGKVDRSRLLDIRGRSRKPQLALARQYGIDQFPNPAGGCLLTEEGFAAKVRESFGRDEHSLRHLALLKVGRHFRLPSGDKLIAGRDRQENETLLELSLPDEPKFTVQDVKSTYVLLLGDPTEENAKLAAGICARYSDGQDRPSLVVRMWRESPPQLQLLPADPIDQSLLESLRIGG
jgi:tRNA-specific 2-thiouridylase